MRNNTAMSSDIARKISPTNEYALVWNSTTTRWEPQAQKVQSVNSKTGIPTPSR